MPTLQRARSLALGVLRALLTGDPTARRRMVDPLRARLRPTPVTGLDPLLAGYVRGAEQVGVDDLVATALRTRSTLLREAARELAERTGAVSWRAGYAELLTTSGETDLVRRGSAVFAELVDQGHGDQLSVRQALLHAHTLLQRQIDTGDGAEVLRAHLDRLTQLDPDAVADLRTDLAHPSSTGDQEAWWALLTRRWREAGMLVPRLLTGDELRAVIGEPSLAAFPDGPPLYDRVGPDPQELAARRAGLPQRAGAALGRSVQTADLPLVTVIVTAHRPGPWLTTAIRSLADQTWPNLEVLIVDDASGPQYTEEIARAAALHPRARVVTRVRNGGAYRARNAGLAQAKGDYLAFLDADDWIHPERIERQVLPLLADPDLVATHALAIRTTEDLRLAWLGYPTVRPNAAGLVMPRATHERAGAFDDVRKSADSEYSARIKAVTGRDALLVTPPLQLTRMRLGSLSRSDFSAGWWAGSRLAYLSAYRAWHRHLGCVRDRGELPGQPGGTAEYPDGPPPDLLLDWATEVEEADPDEPRPTARPFAAPHAWQTTRALPPFDVLIVDDAADAMAGRDDLVGAIAGLRGLGPHLRIALLHRENPARLRLVRKPLLSDLRQVLDHDHHVLEVQADEHVDATVTWIRRPEALSVARPAPDLQTRHVVVTEPTTTRTHRTDPAWTRAAVEAELVTWGVPAGSAIWLPEACAEARVHHLLEEKT